MRFGTTIEPGMTAEPDITESTAPEPKILWTEISALKQPSAFVPIVLSLAAFLLVLGNSIFLGMGHAAEGSTTDNIFRVLIGAQLPVVIFRILRRAHGYPKETLGVLAMHAAAAFLALSVDFILT